LVLTASIFAHSSPKIVLISEVAKVGFCDESSLLLLTEKIRKAFIGRFTFGVGDPVFEVELLADKASSSAI